MTATLDWYGCATFRLRVAGLTIMLDAYIDRVPGAAGTGLTADAIDASDWIVVGHSHFDHLWGAERIMANTKARLIASYESVRVMEQAGVPLDRMICVAGGETVDLGNGVTVEVFPSQHSCVWSHAGMSGADQVCLGDLGVTWQEQQERMAKLGGYLASLGDATRAHLAASAPGHSRRGDGGALVYLFRTPEGTLLYQDTSGHWSGVLGALRPTWPSWPPPVAATPTANRSRVRWPSSSPGRSPCCIRSGCCSATTTTGCPASRWRRTPRRSAPPSPPRHPVPSSWSPGTSRRRRSSPASDDRVDQTWNGVVGTVTLPPAVLRMVTDTGSAACSGMTVPPYRLPPPFCTSPIRLPSGR